MENWYSKVLDNLSVRDQLEIWNTIGINELYRSVTSPFRPDKKPKCFLREYNGLVLFTDWAFPKYNKYTCIHAIADLACLKLGQAARYIYTSRKFKRPIKLISKPIAKGPKIPKPLNGTEIHFIPFTYNGKSTWTQTDKKYWGSRYATSDELESVGLYSVHSYYINNKHITPQKYPCYAMTINGKVKIYQPNSKEFKWFSNTTKDDVWKIEGTENVCVVAASLKDALPWARYTNYHVHAFMSETTVPIDNDYTKFDYIIIAYDNDTVGIINAYKLLDKLVYKYAQIFFFPLKYGKDTDDVLISMGEEAFIKYLDEKFGHNTKRKILESIPY